MTEKIYPDNPTEPTKANLFNYIIRYFIMRSCSDRANKDLYFNFIQNKVILGSNNIDIALEYSFKLMNVGNKYVNQY